MGVEYRLILNDEFDWGYANFHKSDLLDFLQDAEPLGLGLKVEASIPYMVVVACERQYPANIIHLLQTHGVPFDTAYWQEDNNPRFHLGYEY